MIEVINIEKIYNNGKKNAFCALKEVSFSVSDGELIAVIGKSGAGKSTLMHILGGIDRYESGSCKVEGMELSELSEKGLAQYRQKVVGIVMQDFALVEDYTVEENILLPLIFGSVPKKKHQESIERVLNYMGIAELRNKQVRQLSGGQKQRTAIARAIVNDPKIILCDEPTGSLDTKNGQMVLDHLKSLQKLGKTVIIITHDMSIASQCDRMLQIEDGRIVM